MASFYVKSDSSSPNQMKAISELMEVRDRNYIEDLLVTMFEDQSDHLHSKFTESYTKYRDVVAEWMIEVTDYFNLHITTTHAAISYLDRLQPNEQFSRFEWQMLAICCILISSKFHECEEHVPPLRKLEDITQQTISNECVLSYELWALKKMSWKLNARTPVAFLSSYIKLGYLFFMSPSADSLNSSEKEELQHMVLSLASKCIVLTQFKTIPSSVMAAVIVYYARKISHVMPVWTPEMTRTMFHNPTKDSCAIKAMELLCSLEYDQQTWEEFLLTVQDSKRNAFDQAEQENQATIFSSDEEYEDCDVQEMCEKLNNMLAEFTSPDGKSANKENEATKRSPVSIAGLAE